MKLADRISTKWMAFVDLDISLSEMVGEQSS